jgi:hypothetical protein
MPVRKTAVGLETVHHDSAKARVHRA